MKFTKALSLCAAAVLMSVASMKASAASVDLDYITTTPGSSVKYTTSGSSSPSSTITAGRFTFDAKNWSGSNATETAAVTSLVGTSIKTWCIQLNEGLPSAYGTYTLLGGSYGSYGTPLSSVLDKVQALFNQFYGGLDLNAAHNQSSIDSGAFQIALWELMTDGTSGAGVLGAGNFRVAAVSGNTNSSDAITKATQMLNTLSVAGYKDAGTYLIYQLRNNQGYPGPYQDQIFAVPGTTTNIPPVPVPAALPSGIALLAGLGIYRKVRRKSNEA